MSDVVRSQWLKVVSTPSTWWMSTIAVAVVVLAVSLTLGVGTVESGADVKSLFSFAGTGGLVVLLIGVAGGAAEYRYRTIVADLLVAPSRSRHVMAQTLANVVLGLVLGAVCIAVACAIALPWLAARGTGLAGVTWTDLAGGFAGSLVYCASSAAIGLAIGSLARNQVAAVAVIFVTLAIIDPLVSGVSPTVGRFGPSAIGIAMTGGTSTDNGPFAHLLPIWEASLIYLAVAVLLVMASYAVADRRDIA